MRVSWPWLSSPPAVEAVVTLYSDGDMRDERLLALAIPSTVGGATCLPPPAQRPFVNRLQGAAAALDAGQNARIAGQAD